MKWLKYPENKPRDGNPCLLKCGFPSHEDWFACDECEDGEWLSIMNEDVIGFVEIDALAAELECLKNRNAFLEKVNNFMNYKGYTREFLEKLPEDE